MFLVRNYWAIASHRITKTEQEKIGGSNVPSQSTIHNFARKLEKKGDLNEGGKHLRQMSEAATEDVAGRLRQSL